jgi:serine/threonine protein kinase
MPESVGPGSTFAGCQLESVAGRGGMGIVYRATQLGLQRPVALKIIAPDLAADASFRERFQRESHLAASIDHPNVIPVYEAGELDGTLYLIMRWVEGTDLRTLLATSGPLPPRRAIALMRPVASALAAAHMRGLVHRDIKPANVLVARGPEAESEHVYLTDFGIARRADSESITRTAMFVGTVDYTAPERLQGGKGDAASDIYSFGCVLYETVTGHRPYERPSAVSTIYAHVSDPIPSACAAVAGVPERLDAIIARAMAKQPEDRFGSARELVAALAEAEAPTATGPTAVETPPPDAPPPHAPRPDTPPPDMPEHNVPTAATDETPTRIAPVTVSASRSRRSPVAWLVPLVLLCTIGVLIATFSDVHTVSGSPESGTSNANRVTVRGAGMTVARTLVVAAVPGGLSIGRKNLWISLPDRGQLVRTNLRSGARDTFPANGRPTAVAAGTRALWVAPSALPSLAQFNGDSGAQVHAAKLGGRPRAIALATNDSTVWVSDSSGTISHISFGPDGDGTPAPVLGTPARSEPVATSLAWGEGWLWGTTGAPNGLVRVSLDGSGSSTTYRAGERPVAVAVDQGVWIANANGHVTRFDPRPGQLRVNADVAVASDLDGIAAAESSPFVWAVSKSQRTVYRMTTASTPALTGRIVFGSEPVALAADAHSLWVATQDRKVTEIRF